MKSHTQSLLSLPAHKSLPVVKTNPRILVVSQRGYYMPMFRCSSFEFEDVICAVDDADLLLPTHDRLFRDRLFDRIAHYGKVRILTRPRLVIPKIERFYDVLLVNVGGYNQLSDLEPIWETLREHCRLAVCYIAEMWVRGLPNDCRMGQLEKFDYILLGPGGACEVLSRATTKPVMHLPFGIDMERFCPYPNSPRRTIDIYSMGRQSDDIHGALLKWAEQTGSTYLYDTVLGTKFVISFERHRKFTADMIKRSRYFIVNPALFDLPEQNGGQIEVGPRYYEGAGAGAVLIGHRAECAVFNQHFDWPDAVIEMPVSATDVVEQLFQLDVQRERIEQIRRANVVNCLRRHDWVYRWNYFLKQIGMEPTPHSLQREERLQEMADAISKHPSIIDLEMSGVSVV